MSMSSILGTWRDSISRRRKARPGLQYIHDPPDAKVDIVAVHGLDGDFKTWRLRSKSSHGREVNWLHDRLRRDFSQARILTYCYDTNFLSGRDLVRRVLYAKALSLVQDLGAVRASESQSKRPIIFIAHSVGGLIVKGAMIFCRESSELELRRIELSTCALYFFGTPFNGMSSTAFCSALRNALRLACTRPEVRTAKDETLISSTDARWLETKLQAFKPLMKDIQVFSYYETKETVNFGLIVDRQASFASIGSESSQGSVASTRTLLNADHAHLMAFSENKKMYQIFISQLKASIDVSQEKVTSRLAEHKSGPIVIPFQNSADDYRALSHYPEAPATIVSRPELEEPLYEYLTSPAPTPGFRVLVLHGRSGTGKSYIARSLAARAQREEHCGFVYWINAESYDTVIASYLQLAKALIRHYSNRSKDGESVEQVGRALGIGNVDEMLRAKSVRDLDKMRVESIFKAVTEWLLREENRDWLLVYDNVVAADEVFDRLPLTLSGRIILTMRNPDVIPLGRKVEVTEMTGDEAFQLLRSYSDSIDSEGSPARQLVSQLGYLPQSIIIAGTFVKSNYVSLQEYVEQIYHQVVPPPLPGGLLDNYVIDYIVGVGALLSPDPIPLSLLWGGDNVTAPSVEPRFSRATCLEGIDKMKKRKLVQLTPSGDDDPDTNRFLLRRDVRQWALERIEFRDDPSEKIVDLCCRCTDFVRWFRTNSNLVAIQSWQRVMASHARACYNLTQKFALGQEQLLKVDWALLGDICLCQGAIDEAEGFFRLALPQAGAGSVQTTQREVVKMAISLASIPRGSKGGLEPWDEHLRSLDFRKLTNEEQPPSILALDIQFAKAQAKTLQEKYNDAEKDLKELADVLDSLEEAEGVTRESLDFKRATVAQRLAENFLKQDRSDEAQALYERAYFAHEKLLGLDHPLTIEIGEKLAKTMEMEGQYKEACELYERFIAARTASLGAGHPSTASTVAKFAALWDSIGDSEEARGQYSKALEALTGALGKYHPLVLKTRENKAEGLRMEGQYDKAAEILDDVLHLKKELPELYGPDEVAAAVQKRQELEEEVSNRNFDEMMDKMLLDASEPF